MSILDFIKSKEEKQKESKDYRNKVFPHGDVHRDTIEALIKTLFPDYQDFNVFFTYIVIKEIHLCSEAKEEKISRDTERELKKVRPKLKDQEKLLLMILLSIDLQSTELLSYDTYLELVNHSYEKILAQ